MSADTFMNDFLSPAWWVSVVLIGLIINLLSAYAKPQVDTFLGSISSTCKAHVERRRKAYKEKIELYLQNPPLIVIAGAELSHTIYRAIIWLVLAFFMFVYSASPAEELKGTGYLTPPPFVTLPMVKQVARGLSIFLVFSWGFASTSATTQRQFLKDVETRLLGRSKDGQERNLT